MEDHTHFFQTFFLREKKNAILCFYRQLVAIIKMYNIEIDGSASYTPVRIPELSRSFSIFISLST